MRIALVLLALTAAVSSAAQTPPANPALARSSWPIFHQSTYAQASVSTRGPERGDTLEVQFVPTPDGNVSSWTVLGGRYRTGAQAAWGSSRTHVFKAVLDGPRFEMISALRLPRRRFDFDFNIAALADGTIVTTNKSRREFVIIGDLRPGDPGSPIGLVRTLPLPREAGRLATHFSVAYDGTIIFLSLDDKLGALDPQTGRTVMFDLGSAEGDLNAHNAFAIDEGGGVYLLSEQSMSRIDWDGRGFRLAWRAPYDFRGPGCSARSPGRIRQALRVALGRKCTGSGTTPTLLGTRRDGLVVVLDGHSPNNNAVAFWRGEPPAEWRGLPGYDRRVAAVTPAPYSTPDGGGFTAENSPAASGWGFVAAQWNGFRPSCNPLPGVQKFEWDPRSRRLNLTWATDRINMNGILGVSAASELVYQSGRRDCVYRFYGLDWRTGELVIDLPLGDDPRFLDQGNQATIADDRSVLFGTARGLVRIRPY